MERTGMAALVLAAGVIMSACGPRGSSTFPPQQNAVYVSREGELYTALMESYDPLDTGYRAEELQAMATRELADYNSQYGTPDTPEPVTLSQCTMEGGKASVVYQYASPEDLCRFTLISQDTANHPDSLVITTNTAGLTGSGPEGGWTDVRKNSAVTSQEVLKKKDLPMAVVSGPVTVQTEGKIIFYSGAVDLTDEYTAKVTEGTAWIVFR